MLKFLILIFLSSFSNAAALGHSANCKLTYSSLVESKIQMLTRENEGQYVGNPKIEVFTADLGCKLYFIVSGGHTNERTHPTIRKIRDFYQRYSVGLAFVEGFPFADSPLDPSFIRGLEFSDISYAARIPSSRGVPVFGIEAAWPDIFHKFTSMTDGATGQRLTTEDLLGYLYLSEFPEMLLGNNAPPEWALPEILRDMVQYFSPGTNFSYGAFKDWFSEISGEEFSPSRIRDNPSEFAEKNYSAPWSNGALRSQRIGAYMTYVRDTFFLKNIFETMNSNQDTSVVYMGGSHFTTLKDALELAFSD